MNKRLILIAIVLLIYSASSYAQVCEVSKAKDVLRKNLYLYLTNPSSSPLSLNEIKDLLNFYLNINAGPTTVDCSVVGSTSNRPVSVILSNGENVANIIPTCSDGTRYGECSNTKPKYCYSGSLINRCGHCGCPSNYRCDESNNCMSIGINVTCSNNIDCGSNQFTGNYYCSNNWITRNYVNYTCINPGTVNSRCDIFNYPVALNHCNPSLNQNCVGGSSTCEVISPNQTVTDCSDSDGGQNFNVKGTTTKGSLTATDYCGAGNNLFEHYCAANGSLESSLYVCPAGCSIGVCLSETSPCTDSDGGKDYYTPGSVTKDSATYEDYCGAGQSDGSQYMFEKYCNASGLVKEDTFICPTGCDIGPQGACINASEPCLESDGGINFGTKGSITKGKLVFNDYCALGKLVELYCDTNGDKKQEVRACSCSDGACPGYVDPPNVCIDNDNGLDYYTPSTATKGIQSLSDGCGVGNNLFEAYCDVNGDLQSSLYVCPNGCGNGACVSETAPCSDTDGGQNFNVKGTTSKGSLSHTDYCGVGKNLFEGYCLTNGSIVTNYLYVCSNSCSNGACV